ncbi:MAG: hypothetical protein ACO373_03270 [Pontimonas sp.]
MSTVPWLVPTVNPGGISNETRRALGPLATLVEDPRVQDVFVLGGGAVYVDSGRGTFLAEGLRLGKEQALDIGRGHTGRTVLGGSRCAGKKRGRAGLVRVLEGELGHRRAR